MSTTQASPPPRCAAGPREHRHHTSPDHDDYKIQPMTYPPVQRLLIALTQVLSLTVWFSVSAVVPSVQAEFGIGDTASVWLTGTVQLGFVVGR